MIASAGFWSGALVFFTGFLMLPRRRGVALLAAGAAAMAGSLLAPARERRVARWGSRLDALMPAWQFREVHQLYIDASPERVYAATRAVRAEEIFLFRTLTWIRRAGRETEPGILNPGSREPLLDVATRTGFVRLADDPPRELVIGMAVIGPRATAADFPHAAHPDTALAAMNFHITPAGAGSLLRTETRVFANGARARRRFAWYWRLIYPGSSLIRYAWLQAIARRARGR